jgi:NAD(P)-dependent dehydrogenase (short-subunit alcohol dehydrogenase family)
MANKPVGIKKLRVYPRSMAPDVALFLASGAASYVNGQAIAVNGGLDWVL